MLTACDQSLRALDVAQIEVLAAKDTENQALRDELDDYRHKADKLDKTERQLEQLKKRAEEAAELRRQLKVLPHPSASPDHAQMGLTWTFPRQHHFSGMPRRCKASWMRSGPARRRWKSFRAAAALSRPARWMRTRSKSQVCWAAHPKAERSRS